jgi:hypothetical protein
MNVRSSGWLVGLELGAVVLAALCTLLRLAIDLKMGAGSLWWGERLAFAAALRRGIDLYPGPHTGVVTGDVYGPMLAVFYLPAALVPTITGKMIAGQLSSLLVMLLPLAVLLARANRASNGTPWSWALALTLLTGVLATLPATNYQLTAIAADAPCLGFGMWSLVVLTGASRPSYGRLAGAAALVGLATLTKPNGTFMAAGLALVALQRGGLGKGVAFGALYVVLAALLFALIIPATGTTYAGVWFNDFVIPSSQLTHHDLRSFVRGMGKLTLPMFGLLLLTLASRWPLRREQLRPSAWPLLVPELWLMACVLVPVSYLGRAKAGGDINSFHAHYFAAAATVFAWVHALTAANRRPLRIAAFAGLSLLAFPVGRGSLAGGFSDNTHERVYSYLRAHGDAYFPWHTLATLEAMDQFFQQSDGVYSRKLAGRAPTREEFLLHAPRHPRFIGLPHTQWRLPEDFVFVDLVTHYYPGYALVPAPTPEIAAVGVQVFAPVE